MIICENVFICTNRVISQAILMAKSKMNKEQLNATVSKWTKQRSDEYGAGDEYSSTSNFVESALLYYMGALDKEKELRYEDCQKELAKLREECERNSSILLRLLSKHPELLKEANEII